MEPKRILIIEDEADISNIIKNVMGLAQIECAIASNGKQALELLAKHQFDALILDLTLPDVHGVDLYHQIIKDYPHLKGKCLFTTGYNLDPDLEALITQTGDHFMQKPFQLMALKDLMVKLVSE